MNNKGFTLLELLISITIIAILTSISFWGYNTKKDTLSLRGEVNSLVSRAENMRERALGSQYWHEKLPQGGYGIFLQVNTNQYITFADCNGSMGLNLDTDLQCGQLNDFRERIESWTLGNNVIIKDIFVGGILVNDLTVVYRFPFPEAIIQGGSEPAKVVLQISDDPTNTKTINFNSAGLIYVE